MTAFEDAPFPANRLGVAAQPVALVGASFIFTGIYLLYLNGEYVPAY